MSRIVVGKTTFRSTVMDGNPMFRVTRSLGNGVYEATVEPNEPDCAGHTQVFRKSDIDAKLAMAAFWTDRDRDRQDFWSSVPLGAIIHYHNGFQEFVRGEVVMGEDRHTGELCKQLRPIALVGNWRKHDLPMRRPDGSIYYPYHADKIINGGEDAPFQPSDTCIYESPTYARENDPNNVGDPAKLEPIDLTVPPMTPEEEANAAVERDLQAISKALSERPRDDTGMAAMDRVKAIVLKYVTTKG